MTAHVIPLPKLSPDELKQLSLAVADELAAREAAVLEAFEERMRAEASAAGLDPESVRIVARRKRGRPRKQTTTTATANGAADHDQA